MTWLLTTVGVLIVLAALRDIFDTLMRPQGAGTLSRLVFGGIWRVTRAVQGTGRSSEVAGPLGLLGVIGVWALLVVAGWTLIYLPRMPQGFHFGSSLDPAASSDLVASLYLSLVAVTTLGFGDITPADPFLRIGVPVQALLGFILLTVGISWVLQVYPALGRRRVFAQWLATMRVTAGAEVVRTGEPSIAAGLLSHAADSVSEVEQDLVQYPETYYFRERRRDLSLAAQLRHALDLAEAGSGAGSMEVRHAAALLRTNLESLATTIDAASRRTGAPLEQVLAAFAADHQHAADGD